MFEPIRNGRRARQLVRFDGMALGEHVWPTDFDAVIEWRDEAWLVFEVKTGDKAVPRGQRLALERFVDDVSRAGKRALAAVVEHHESDAGRDVYLASCDVREVYVDSERRWRSTDRPMSALELMDSYMRYIGGEL